MNARHMTRPMLVALIALCGVAFSAVAHAKRPFAATITACIAQVRKISPFYGDFDAFDGHPDAGTNYNQRIKYTGIAGFAFDKCMTQAGYPNSLVQYGGGGAEDENN